MTGLQLLLHAEAAGVRVRLDAEGTLRMAAAAAPPAELVGLLREHRDALLAQLSHDAAEAKAMAEHYATPAGSALAQPDPLAQGLARGFWAHRWGTQS